MGIIRLFLAIAVVAAHTTPIFNFQLLRGQIAVQLFYIISGFYMSMVLNEKYIGSNGSYRLFIYNRFLRIYPIYWTVLLCTFFLFVSAYANNDKAVSLTSHYREYLNAEGTFAPVSIVYLLLTHVLIFGQNMIMFLGINPDTGNLFFTSNFHNTNPQAYKFLLLPQAWSIDLELAFYLIAPFILRKNIKIIVSLIAISLLIRFALLSNGLNYDPWTYRFFPTELVFFLLGYISYTLYVKAKSYNIDPRITRFSQLFFISYLVFYKTFDFPAKGPLCYLLFVCLLPLIFLQTKNSKLDAKIGEYSYPVYISHMLVLYIIQYTKMPLIESLGTTVCIGSLLVSYLLNKFISEPLESIRQARMTRKKALVIQ